MYAMTNNTQPDGVQPDDAQQSAKPPPPVTHKQTVVMGVIAAIVGLALVLGLYWEHLRQQVNSLA